MERKGFNIFTGRSELNPDVWERATRRAEENDELCEVSPFLRKRMTGRVLEKGHELTDELTPKGLREMRVVIPVVNGMLKPIQFVADDPRASLALKPLEDVMDVVGEVFKLKRRNPEETRRELNNQIRDFENLLRFNLEKDDPESSIRKIDLKGNVTW